MARVAQAIRSGASLGRSLATVGARRVPRYITVHKDIEEGVPDRTPHTPLYLDTPEDVEQFTRTIAHTKQLALDTEGASFHRFVDRVYLLQLSTREHSAVIDPLPTGQLEALGQLVESPDVEVIFHDADYDLRLLGQDYGWKTRNIFDTRVAAQLLGFKAFGLAALLDKYFGVTLDKKHQRADWSMRPLTADMLAYASQDTMYLHDLRDQLHQELEKKGRLGWAKEEFARLEKTRWEPEDPALGFMRIKGARDLDRRELALFRELVQWRDALAKQLDRSTFRVVGNETLMDIARQRPADAKTLMSIKGMPRGIGERHATEILEAVERGIAVPDSELPQFPRAPRWDKDPDFDARVNALRTVRDEAAKRLDLDPGVLGSRERLESIARRMPQSVEDLLEIPDLRRWQIEEFGEAAVRAVNSIASAPPGAGQPAAPGGRRPRGGRGRNARDTGAAGEAGGQVSMALGGHDSGASGSLDAETAPSPASEAPARATSPSAAPDAPAPAPVAESRPATLPPRGRSGGRGGLGSRRGSPHPATPPNGGTNGGAGAGGSAGGPSAGNPAAPVNGPVSSPSSGGRAGAPLRKGEHKDDRSPYRDD
jgi:ribonuclease D